MKDQSEFKDSSQTKAAGPLPKLNLLSLTLSEPERWALTKAALLAIKVQDGLYEPEEQNQDDVFTSEEFRALESAFQRMNPECYGQSAIS